MEIKENSVELWCEEVKKRCNTRITEENSKVLITCLLNKDKIDEDEEVMKLLEGGKSYASVLWKRIKYGAFTYTITPSAIMFLDEYLTDFGVTTMMSAFLQGMSHKLKAKEITIDTIARDIFPFGVPSEKDWNELWDMQKVKDVPDNMLDHSKAYESVWQNT